MSPLWYSYLLSACVVVFVPFYIGDSASDRGMYLEDKTSLHLFGIFFCPTAINRGHTEWGK